MSHPIFTSAIALFGTLAFAAAAHTAQPASQPVAFDQVHHAIGLNVVVKGQPLYVLLDTGVDPSVIDLARAKALQLPMQAGQGGQAPGEGSGQTHVFPATIKALAIDGQPWGDVDALAMDMTGLSKSYGRPLDGVLGYSFLVGKTVLIDYPASTVTFYQGSHPLAAAMKQCTRRYATPLVFAGADDRIPVLPDFRFGNAKAKISLDTGSNRGVSLFPKGSRSRASAPQWCPSEKSRVRARAAASPAKHRNSGSRSVSVRSHCPPDAMSLHCPTSPNPGSPRTWAIRPLPT